MKKIFLIAILLFGMITTKSQQHDNLIFPTEITYGVTANEIHKEHSGRINFFVFTKEKSKKTDWLAIYTLARASQ